MSCFRRITFIQTCIYSLHKLISKHTHGKFYISNSSHVHRTYPQLSAAEFKLLISNKNSSKIQKAVTRMQLRWNNGRRAVS